MKIIESVKIIEGAYVEKLALALIYNELVNDRRTAFTLAQLHASLGKRVSKNVLKIVLFDLVESKLLSPDTDPIYSYTKFRLTRRGLTALQEEVNDPLSRYFRLFDDVAEFWADRQTDENPPEAGDIEVTDEVDIDTWEPLPLDRNSPGYQEAISSLEDVVERVQADNGYAANEPDERNRILWSLETGLQALRSQLPTLRQLNELVIRPLLFLTRKFAESAIGEVAKVAIKAIQTWLGL